jgi:hypothetical protein
MANFIVERILDEPIIVATAFGEFEASEDMPLMAEEVSIAADTVSTNAYVIYDLTNIEADFRDVATEIFLEGGLPGSVTDPSLRMLVVGFADDWELIQEDMRQSNIGFVDVPFFESVEEALDYIRINS